MSFWRNGGWVRDHFRAGSFVHGYWRGGAFVNPNGNPIMTGCMIALLIIFLLGLVFSILEIIWRIISFPFIAIARMCEDSASRRVLCIIIVCLVLMQIVRWPVTWHYIKSSVSNINVEQNAPAINDSDIIEKKITHSMIDNTPTTENYRTNNSVDGAELVFIPAGVFIMGTNELEYSKPPHSVSLNAYYIYKTHVTVAQYQKFCHSTGRQMPKKPRWGWIKTHPIVNVYWEDAFAYAQWAGASLPTEAQWEKAARGTDERAYPWGNEWDARKCQCSKKNEGDTGRTAPVGSFPAGASPYGVLDMAGNVEQWCSDWYEAYYDIDSYPMGPIRNPTGPADGDSHVLRGGSWYNCDTSIFLTTGRLYLKPNSKNLDDIVFDKSIQEGGKIGFRCVVKF